MEFLLDESNARMHVRVQLLMVLHHAPQNLYEIEESEGKHPEPFLEISCVFGALVRVCLQQYACEWCARDMGQ